MITILIQHFKGILFIYIILTKNVPKRNLGHGLVDRLDIYFFKQNDGPEIVLTSKFSVVSINKRHCKIYLFY